MSAPRSRRALVGLAAGLGAMVAVAGFVLPRSAAPADHDDDTTVLSWVAEKQADTEPRHPEVGDSWVTYLQLREGSAKGGNRPVIGDGSAKCSAVAVTDRGIITQCQRVLRTDRGTIALSAMIDRFGAGPYTGPSAVVGGTGAYAGAEGQATITLDGPVVRFRIELDD
ncbi:hypothetical protein HY68_12410 [Streptomyces sp. AcH 505]|uniref:hypothetical protein n=1 Tax=Streptomyces sp. AcH 505 TaxID=352211 RepID=UPI0005919E27|nr:hypothetical protein HY68_12410 [Streptomyces sp. AcH 505]